ncbi:MAG TPA: DNA cytosine methyltransferase [Jiangellaceae bacterium]
MTLTMTDLFCGAGGSSSGAVQVPGVSVRMAANHWALAIETHNTNHPDTDHDIADLSGVDPRRYPRTDILWASPECTNHSQAKGRRRNADATPDLLGEVLPDAAADRSRATMWDVPRFAEAHAYRAIVVENVVDAAKWVMWPAWLQAMTALGYSHHVVYLNSMHAGAAGLPAPQSRDRLYVVFWRQGERRPDLERWTRPTAWCDQHGPVQAIQAWKRPDARWGRYRQQYVYRCPNVACRNQVLEPAWLPAAAAIDWTIPGERIGDRARPLAAKTMARIQAGLERFARDPFLTVHRHEYRTATLDKPSPTLTASGNHLGLLVPVEGRDGKQATTAAEALRTMTTRNETAFVVPLRNNNTSKATAEPFDTFAAAGTHHAMVMRNNGTRDHDPAWTCTPTTETLRTLTTGGHQSLVDWSHMLVPAGGTWNDTPTPISDVMRTRTTRDSEGLASVAVDVDDCLFRMLEPHEIARGMAFSDDYVIHGNKRERVRQAGNAVTPPAARDLLTAVTEAITGQEVAA